MNINKAILHVFDFVSCVNVFAQAEMDLGNKTAKRYVTSQAKRAVGNLDSKRGTFAENSLPRSCAPISAASAISWGCRSRSASFW